MQNNFNSSHAITITFMSGPLDGKTVHFKQPPNDEELVITIGRRENCDIHLVDDNQASRIHARLGCALTSFENTDSSSTLQVLAFWLEDAGSRNGTYIGKISEPIKGRITLRPGELFRVGRTWLRLDIPFSY